MSREPSYFEHNGMPLQAANGRVRHIQEPWLGSFTAHPAQPTELQRPGNAGGVMPKPSDEVMTDEAEGGAQRQPAQASANEPSAAPNLLQRASGATGVQSRSAIQPNVNPQQPHSTSAARAGAQPNEPHKAVSAPMGKPHPVGLRQSEPTPGAEINTAGGHEGASANRVTGGAGSPHDASDAAPLPPRVLVQKHARMQTEISSMSTAEEPATMSLPGRFRLPLMVAMGSPMAAGAAATETGEKLRARESFSTSALFAPGVPVHFEVARGEMGAGNIPGGNTRPPTMPESQPHSDRSLQTLLDRLNDRAAPRQQEGGGQRVHIGNLRITVQRPPMATAQAAPSVPPAQPQAAAAAQTLFNPWERHYMAFD